MGAITSKPTNRSATGSLPNRELVEPKTFQTDLEITTQSEANKVGLFNVHKIIGIGSSSVIKLVTAISSGHPYVFKILSKASVKNAIHLRHILNEKQVLKIAASDYVVKLVDTFQDLLHLYLVFEYVPGGELFRVMCAHNTLSMANTRFYAAELVCALSHLHALNCIHRDLKPENILITASGHIRLADFGLAKFLQPNEKTYTVCGTPEYFAPETIERTGQSYATDMWELGVLIFEMLVGYTPFVDRSPYRLYEKILTEKVEFPDTFPSSAKDLVNRLLHKLPEHRLTAEHIKNHHFFEGVDWEDAAYLRLKPLYVPVVTGELDTGNFDNYDEPEEEANESDVDPEVTFKEF